MRDRKLNKLSCTHLLLLVVAALWVSVPSLHAQVTSSSILGTVTDSSGAVIPHAQVTVTDVERNVTKATTSNEQGIYRVDALITGNYTVSISAAGFNTYIQKIGRAHV